MEPGRGSDCPVAGTKTRRRKRMNRDNRRIASEKPVVIVESAKKPALPHFW